MPVPVVIDCDPGHDDAIALLLAVTSPELEVLAVTTVAGNQTLDKTTANAIRVLELAGRGDIPVARGAARPLRRDLVVADWVHGESGLDGPFLPAPVGEPAASHGVDLIAEVVSAADKPVTLIPTGPLTNIALLLERHPTLESRLARIVLMGGSIAEGNVTPAAEFNIWADPEAAAAVFGSGLDVTMIGLDVTHQALLTTPYAERLRATGPVGAFVSELAEFFHHFHRETYGFAGPPVHDAVAVAHVVWPDLLQTIHCNVEIELDSELCRGRTVVDRWRRTGNAPNAHVAVDIEEERFLELLVERIGSLG
jgi:pyrimidine-specific ribonucleoside hydrolase